MLIVLLIIASSDLITRITPSTFRPTVRSSSTKPIAVREILTQKTTQPLSGDPNALAALLLASANQNSSVMTVNIINLEPTVRPSSVKPIAVTRPRSPTIKVILTTKKPVLTPRTTKPLRADPNALAALVLLLASANQNSSAMTVNIINVEDTLSSVSNRFAFA
jgi:hypothetical protein